MGQAKTAATGFKHVLDRSRKERANTKNLRAKGQTAYLEKEALEDLAITFSEYGGASEAYRFMQQVGDEQYSIRVLSRLAEVFFRQARFEQAIGSYRLLIKKFPWAEKSPEHQLRIVEAYQHASFVERSLQERRRLAKNYGPQSAWIKKHENKPSVINSALKKTEQSLRFVAIYRHKKAQESKKKDSYKKAQTAYLEYLKYFPDSEHTAQLRYNLGEVMFRLQSYENAASHYAQAAKLQHDPHLRDQAAYASILAFDRWRESNVKPKEPPQKKQALSTAEEGFIQAVETFYKISPADKKIAQLRFEVGQVYYYRGHFQVAAERLLDLVESLPNSSFSEPAADLALDCFNRLGDWQALEKWSREFHQSGRFQNSKLQNQLPGFIAASIYQSALISIKKHDYARANRAFEKLLQEFPKDRLAGRSLFFLATSYERLGKKEKAIKTYKLVIEKYPHQSARALFSLAKLFERQYNYPAAARTYERFANRFKKDPRAPDCLLQASMLHRASEKYLLEAKALASFLRRFSNHPAAAQALFLRAAALEKQKRFKQAEKILRAYLHTSALRHKRAREARKQLGMVLLRQGHHKQARLQYRRCGAFTPRNRPQGQELSSAAECLFNLAEMEYAEYKKVSLRPPMKRLARLLKIKAKRLKKAEALFTKVVEAGQLKWASAALFRIGDMYFKFAQSIYRAPLPKRLKKRELEIYHQELQSLAFPIEDKAVTAFSISYQMARKHSYYSVWSQKTIQMLRQLDPAQFPPAEEDFAPFTWADSFTDYGLLSSLGGVTK
jgi:TolA-binding protein